MALGELIEDSTGKITGQRVLDIEIPKMETYYRGIPCTDVGTYTSALGEGGVLYGEGQGIITTKDGQGIGKFTAPGKVSFRGSIFLPTPSTSQGGKLSSSTTW